MPATLKTRLFCIAALMLTMATAAEAQVPGSHQDPMVSLAGPRFGITLLSGGITDKLMRDARIRVSPIITQFGWQSEKRFQTGRADVAGLTELVVLVGGVEQNVLLPSLSWIVGLRTTSGFEFGFGPNVTPLGTAVVYVAGVNRKVGELNFPVNVSIVPSESGVRMSVLTGFNAELFRRW